MAADDLPETIRVKTPAVTSTPSPITKFEIHSFFETVMFSFDALNDIDLDSYAYQLYDNSTGTGTPIATGRNKANVFSISVTNTSDSGTKQYWGRVAAVNSAGVVGTYTDLVSDKATSKIGDEYLNSLTAAKITAGTIGSHEIVLNGTGSLIKSSTYNPLDATPSGWYIEGNGKASFGGAFGINYDPLTGVTIGSNVTILPGISAPNANGVAFSGLTIATSVGSGVGGLAIGNDGYNYWLTNGKFRVGSLTNYLYWDPTAATPSLNIVGNVQIGSSLDNGVLVGSSTAKKISDAVINFDNNNDRISTIPAAPSAVTFTKSANLGATVDLNTSWTFTGTGDAYNIDGFIIYLRKTSSTDTSNVESEFAFSALTSVGTTATVTTPSAHGFSSNDRVYVYGVTPSGYNGIYTITVTNTTQFTYTLASSQSAVTVLGRCSNETRLNTNVQQINVTAEKRSHTFAGLPSEFFYKVAIRAYRSVDADIFPSGVLYGQFINASQLTSAIPSLGGDTVAPIYIGTNKLYIGTGNYGNTDTGFYVDGTGKFSLKDKLTFEPGPPGLLTVKGRILTEDAKIGGWTADIDSLSSGGGPVDLVSLVATGSIVTYTTASTHTFLEGDTIKISGVTPSGYSGTFSVLSNPEPTLTTFSVTNSTIGTATFTNAKAAADLPNYVRLSSDGGIYSEKYTTSFFSTGYYYKVSINDGSIDPLFDTGIVVQSNASTDASGDPYMTTISASAIVVGNGNTTSTTINSSQITVNELYPGMIDSTGLGTFARVRTGDGSSGSPVFSFTNDTNTGIFRIAENVIGFSAGGVSRARINTTFLDLSDGPIGITGATSISSTGNITAGGSVTATTKLDCNGTVEFDQGGSTSTTAIAQTTAATIGTICFPTATAGLGNQTVRWKSGDGSSIRFKENIVSLEQTTAELDRFWELDVIEFEYKDEYGGAIEKERPYNHRRRFGFIAEDTEEKVPYLASYDDNNLVDNVKFDSITALMYAEVRKMRQYMIDNLGYTE